VRHLLAPLVGVLAVGLSTPLARGDEPAGTAPVTSEARLRALEERLRVLEEREAARAPAEELRDDDRLGALVEALGDIRLEASVFASGQVHLGRPAGRKGVVPLRAFDVDEGTAVIDYAEVAIERVVGDPGPVGDIGLRVDVGFGRIADLVDLDPEFGRADDAIVLQQAYVTYRLPLPFQVEILGGKFVTWIGAELIEPHLNNTTSRSWAFGLGAPYTHTGVGLRVSPVEGVCYTQYVVNGWERVEDDNDAKTLGGSLVLCGDALSLPVTLTLGWVWGAEQPDRDGPKRLLLDGVLLVQPFEALRLGVEVHYGREQEANPADPTRAAAWYGAAGLVTLEPIEDLVLALRVEHFRDRDGARSGVARTLRGVTFALEKSVAIRRARVGVRAEVRSDWSDDRAFPRGSRAGASRDQQTVSLALFVAF
jgi:hypothetical protein